jgi:hypothetical protein
VKEADKDAFEDAVAAFLVKGGFARLDPSSKKDLVMALRSDKAFPYDGFNKYEPALVDPSQLRVDTRAKLPSLDTSNVNAPSTKNTLRYVHLWRIRDIAELDLVRLMTLSGDDDLYLKVDALVVRETQNFVTRLTLPNHTGEIPQQRDVNIVRITRYIPTRDLGDFVFSFGGFLPILEADGIELIGTFQSVTGTLNIVTEFWKASEGSDVDIGKFKPLLQSATQIVDELATRQKLHSAPRSSSASAQSGVSHLHEKYSPYIAISKQMAASSNR